MARAAPSRARFGGAVVAAVVVAGAALALRPLAGEVGGRLPGPGVVAGVVALNLAGNALLVAAWRRLLRAAGTPLGAVEAARIWVPAQLARYTIGAAQVPGRVVAGARRGVAPGAGMLTTLAEVVWLSCVIAALVLATVPWWLAEAGPWRWVAGAAVLPVAVLVAGLVAPGAVLSLAARTINLVTARFHLPTGRHTGPPGDVLGGDGTTTTVVRTRIGDGMGGDRRVALAVTGRYLAVVGLRVGATLAVFGALGGDVAGEAARVAGAWGVGQLAGQLAVFAPGGLGAREGAAALVLAPALGGELAALLVTLVRLGEMAAELVGLAALRLLRAN